MDVDEMTEVLRKEKNSNGYKSKIYAAERDAQKGESLQADIRHKASALMTRNNSRVNWSDLSDVERRTFDYFEACAAAEVFPSVMGLASMGYGISRQALNQHLLNYPNAPETEFVNRARDVIADILTNASLYGRANPIMTIFQLKNHFGHADRIDVTAVPAKADPLDIGESRESLISKLQWFDSTKEWSECSTKELQSALISYNLPND